MGAPRPVDPGPQWMENGFPPRTFPVERGGTVGAPGGPGGAGPARRRRRKPWVAAAAVLIALLLVAAGLALASRDDDDGADLAANGTTTTIAAIETSVPTFDTTTILDTTTTSAAPTTTTVAPEAPATTVAAAGVLETSTPTLAIPRVNAAAGPQSARLTLRNSGPGPLSYTTQPGAPGLTASPARGTIAAGGMTELTVSLDGSRVSAEGPFTGTLTIGGTGGIKAVQVTSTVGRPPVINDVALTSSPCTNGWAYSARVTDQSQIQSVSATARIGLANGDAPLLKGGQASGSSGTFQSRPLTPVPAGLTLRFFIEATDQLGFSVRQAEQTFAC